MKKIILTIGSISAIAIPTVAFSCGSSSHDKILSIDLDTMTQQEAKDWMTSYEEIKTTFNINIHMIITRSGTPAYDVVWVKGADREHSNYGRGENIDIYGPGDDFYDCYYEILAKSQEQP